MGLCDWFGKYFEFLSRGRRTAELADWIGLPIEELRSIEPRYRQFYIKKRSGGQRLLNAPEDDLKRVQRRIHRRLLRRLKAHPAAVGFERGKSIVTGAKQHVGQAVVVSFDLVDFFPSIDANRVYRYFRCIGWNRPASNLLVRLVTHDGVLPQGAPTSPRLSNLICYGLDTRLAGLVETYGGVYTRYADDITISLAPGDWDTERLVSDVLRLIRAFGFRPHLGRKFDVRRRHQRQEVTGLVVNDAVHLPRHRRRWLRSVKHRATAHWGYVDPSKPDSPRPVLCKPPTITEQQFAGWLAFEMMVEAQAH